jgi:lipopolysaccharide assembly protein A
MADTFKGNLKLSGFCLLAILILVVIIQNTQPVETKVLLWQFTLPRALLLLATLASGFGGGYLFAILRRKRMRRPEAGEPDVPSPDEP